MFAVNSVIRVIFLTKLAPDWRQQTYTTGDESFHWKTRQGKQASAANSRKSQMESNYLKQCKCRDRWSVSVAGPSLLRCWWRVFDPPLRWRG